MTARLVHYGPAMGFIGSAFFAIASLVAGAFSYLYTGTGSDRPDVSVATVLAWPVLIGIMGWVLVASATWWRSGRGSRNTA